MSSFDNCPYFKEASDIFNHIMNLPKDLPKIPPISMSDGERILRRLKPSVIDYYSITSHHFLHLGQAGLLLFVSLMNLVLRHVRHASVEELNNVFATILFKGGHKEPELDKSWRTISCCSLIAKAISSVAASTSIYKLSHVSTLIEIEKLQINLLFFRVVSNFLFLDELSIQ